MTWSQIKLIAVIAMTIDHIAAILPFIDFPLFGLVRMSTLMHFIGRMAFPIFVYGIAQGCVYTHNWKKYLGRLLAFALISEIPYRIAFGYEVSSIGFYNIFFTLFAGAASCFIIHLCKEHRMIAVSIAPIVLILLATEILGTEYGAIGTLSIIFSYLLIHKKSLVLVELGFIFVLYYIVTASFSGFSFSGFCYPQFNWMLPGISIWPYVRNALGALIGVLLLLFYNGKKGNDRLKWFFYTYYPIHLLLLYLGNGIYISWAVI